MATPDDDGSEFSPEDGWSLYSGHTHEPVEHELKELVHLIARGLDLQLFVHGSSDFDELVEHIKSEVHRLAETKALRNAVAFEFGFEPDVEVWKPQASISGKS